MKTFLSICLFFSIMAPAVLLTCNKCRYPITCTELSNQTCPANEKLCMTTALSTNILPRDGFIKYARCTDITNVPMGEYSLSSADDSYLYFSYYSCNTSYCNPIPQVPEYKELPLNGLQCPACFTHDVTNCESTEVVNCRLNEDQCIDLVASFDTLFLGSTRRSLKGCATENFCGFLKSPASKYHVRYDFGMKVFDSKCSPAPESSSELGPEE